MKQSSPSCEVVVTRNGATAMLDHRTGEVMHPLVPPMVEAAQLYVVPARLRERLDSVHQSPLVLLDVGLGAGSNALSAWAVCAASPAARRKLELVSFDRSLEAFELARRPEHAAQFGFEGELASAAAALAEHGYHSSPRGSWRVHIGELPAALMAEPAACADVVFWDPFSPRANPELWSFAAFTCLRRVCREGATVHTYSAATATRAALLLAGFAVGFGEATGDKGQTTVAALTPDELSQPLDRRWLERLARSSAPFPADAPPDALEQIEALAQFSAA